MVRMLVSVGSQATDRPCSLTLTTCETPLLLLMSIGSPAAAPREAHMDNLGANADRLWTCAEVAQYLGVPVKTLYYWRCQGLGPRGARLGKHLRYRAEDVRAWVEMQLTGT
jgi:excisionase family DNA binding protein